MTRDLDALTRGTFDLAVVGAGITGACIAHDAALRGLTVALLERDDFGSATSAASSKLIHGGIRYLQQLQFGKVRESASERAAFLQIAPHLIRWLPFLIPTSRSLSKGRLLLGAGIRAYRLLTAGTPAGEQSEATREPTDRYLSRRELLARHPVLESLPSVTGAWVIHEAHMHSSERMSLAFVKSAASRGAVVANHAAVVRILRDGSRVTGLEVEDRLTGRRLEVAARLVVNAAGPWIGLLNAPLGAARLDRDITAFSKGVHLVTRPLLQDAAIAIPTHHRSQAVFQRGGRHFFVIPWRGRSLIGTTNVPFAGTPDRVDADASDVASFLADINDALPAARLTLNDVRYAFAGLYPLTEEVIRPEVFQGTGIYQLVDHATAGGLENFVSALGAKYTTARGLAERTVDLALHKLGVRDPGCATRTVPLLGGDVGHVATFRRDTHVRHRAHLPAAVIDHLCTQYGTEVDAVVRLGQRFEGGLSTLAPDEPVIEAELRFAVEHEMAASLADVVFRRTGLGTAGHPGRSCLERCAALMADALGWTHDRRRQELDAVERRFSVFRV